MVIQRYANIAFEFDSNKLGADRYAFSVLTKILRGPCRLTLTDGERFIICHSKHPYPVWVWIAPNATEAERAFIYKQIKEHFGFDGLRYNTTYEFAHYMIEKAKQDGVSLSVSTNMHAYTCKTPIPPKKSVVGTCRPATEADTEQATDFINAFHDEIGVDRLDTREAYREKAKRLIDEHALYLLENGAGVVAMASYTVRDSWGHIGNVYTLPAHRRCGYAAHLVYNLCLAMQRDGILPLLYTDADYEASNACYTGIGFVLEGSLCTIG